jgi:hypothetical protein
MTSVKKKSRKNLYGTTVENLEDNSKKIMKTIGSLKLFHDQKIINQLDILYNENNVNDSSYEIMNCYRPSPYILGKYKNISGQQPKIKNSKIHISYHKSKPKKMYFGSKTTSKKKKSKGQNEIYFHQIPNNYDHKYSYLSRNKRKK